MDLEQAKVWLYRAQQRLSITRSEATALLAVAALLAVGMAARHLQSQPRAAPGSPFAATDHRFQQGAARLRAAQQQREDAPAPLAAGSSAPVDLNAASPPVLERLPGVGPVLAGRIVAYREANGAFAEAGHLQRVRGIGPKTMQALASLVTVAAPPDSASARPPRGRNASSEGPP